MSACKGGVDLDDIDDSINETPDIGDVMSRLDDVESALEELKNEMSDLPVSS